MEKSIMIRERELGIRERRREFGNHYKRSRQENENNKT